MLRRAKILIVLLIAALGLIYVIFFLKNSGGSTEEARIVVPKGMTVGALTDTLAAHDLIRSKFLFSLAARALGVGGKLHAGVYRVSPSLSNSQVISRFTGSEYALLFQATFPEGITMRKAAQIAREKLQLDSALFMKYATDSAFIHSLGVPREAKTAEGYLFPDTYQFVLTTDPKALVTRMIAKWRTVVTDSVREKAKEMELTVPELMTFASIVESEARLPSERDTIAGVYWNRVNQDMKLDADPTVQYGLHLTRPITHDDLLIPNPYNTYQNTGLPPGPINNPGAAAIRAVLNPAHHNKIYFVARRDGSGGHYFSHSLEEQSRMINVAHSNAAE